MGSGASRTQPEKMLTRHLQLQGSLTQTACMRTRSHQFRNIGEHAERLPAETLHLKHHMIQWNDFVGCIAPEWFRGCTSSPSAVPTASHEGSAMDAARSGYFSPKRK